MHKPRVHVITKYFYPVAAGIETNILETYSKLANIWDITIHTSADEYLRKNSLPRSARLRALNIKRYLFKGEVTGYLASIDYKTADIVALHNFNIFFWRYFVLALYHRLIGTKKYRLIVTPHGGFTPEWSMFPALTRLGKYVYHRIFGSLFINYLADETRCVSLWERAEMIKMGVHKGRITTITNGLEDEAFMDVNKLASLKTKQFVKQLGTYIIQVGRIYPIKNYETMIRALPLIPEVKYLIVGQVEKSAQFANYKDDLINLAKQLGVADRLIFGGVVRGVDKYYLIKHSKLMVHMAIWESFCNVVHEGMSQGKVCIVANNTALPLLIKDGVNGYTVATKDSAVLADKINLCLSPKHKKIIQKIESHNQMVGQNDSWANVAQKMYELYVGAGT